MFLATRKVQVQPGQKQEFVETWHNAIGSRLKRQQGFITAWLLTSINSDEVLVMSHWHTEADHTHWRKSDLYRQIHAHIDGLTLQYLGDKSYTIAALIEPAGVEDD